MTVGAPSVITPPCAVMSPIRAAGIPPIMTFADPATIVSGGPAQVHMSPTRAAGMPAIRTVGAPGGMIGPPTCGTTPVTIGQVCMSPTRAAGGIRRDCPGPRGPRSRLRRRHPLEHLGVGEREVAGGDVATLLDLQ